MDKAHSTPLREAKVAELAKLLLETATDFAEKIPEASGGDRVIIVGEGLKDAWMVIGVIESILKEFKEKKPPGEKPEPESPGAPS